MKVGGKYGRKSAEKSDSLSLNSSLIKKLEDQTQHGRILISITYRTNKVSVVYLYMAIYYILRCKYLILFNLINQSKSEIYITNVK